MMQIKINPLAVKNISIKKLANGEFEVTIESEYKTSYYQGYNKINSTSVTKGSFIATKIEDIIGYVKELDKE